MRSFVIFGAPSARKVLTRIASAARTDRPEQTPLGDGTATSIARPLQLCLVYRQALSRRSSAKPQPRIGQNRIRRVTGWRERYCPPVNYSAINCPFSVQLADFAVLLALYGLTAESQCSWQVQLIEAGKGQSRSSGRRRIAVVENLYVPRVVAKFRRAVPPVPGELLTRFKRRPGIAAVCPDAMVLRTFGLIN
jgi:hypothetical protein